MKDRNGIAQFLLVATLPFTGIEDPALQESGSPDYFLIAWNNLGLVQERLEGAPHEDQLSLAVNSSQRRSQDRLHIHLDCLRVDVWSMLRQYESLVGRQWTSFPTPLAGQTWRALRVDSLSRPFPIAQLYELADAREDMWTESVAVVQSRVPGEFLLLESRYASGESLQDHDCAIAVPTLRDQKG